MVKKKFTALTSSNLKNISGGQVALSNPNLVGGGSYTSIPKIDWSGLESAVLAYRRKHFGGK